MADATTEMILRIKTDTAQAQTGLTQMTTKIQGLSAAGPKAAGQLKAGFSAMAGQVAIATAAIGATVAVLTDLATAAQEAQLNEQRFDKALEQAGITSESAVAKWKNYASTIQEVTTFDDDAAMSMMQLALSMGATEEQLDDVTQGGIGLAKMFGMDVNQGIKMATMGMNGQYTMLSRYIPELRNASTEAEKAAIFQRKLAEGFDLAKVEAQSSAGKMAQLDNHIGNLKESLGSFLLPVLDAAVQGLTSMTNAVQGVVSGFQSLNGKDMLEGTVNLLSGIVEYSTLGLVDLGKMGDAEEKAAEKSNQARKKQQQSVKETVKVFRTIGMIEEELASARDALRDKASVKSAKDEEYFQKQIKMLEAELDKRNGVVKKTKAAAKEVKSLSDIIKEKYDSGEQNVLNRRLFGEASPMSAAAALQNVSASLMAMRQPLGDIALLSGVDIDWEEKWGRDAIESATDELEKYGDMMKSIGGIMGTAMFEQDGMKSALKASLNMLINYAEAQLLVATAVAALRGVFGDVGGLVAVGAGVVLLEAARAGVASFRTGIDYVPTDAMPALLHKGEAVLKEDEAERYRRGQAPMGSGNKGKTTKIAFSRFESVIEDNHINTARRYA